MTGPLQSLRILDFTTLLPGPFATMMLADLGATVTRVEAPHRPDMVRLLPPFDGDTAAWHSVLNRNKRSVALDLKHPQAGTIVRRLVEPGGHDIVMEQFRPGVMERLGLDYESLRATNPALIYCSLTGYGQTGPDRDRAGHDINFTARSGIMSYSGRAAGGPPPLGVQLGDIGGGAFGALVGLLAAVIHRQATGEGQAVDISMHDMLLAWQAHLASHVLVAGEMPQPESMPLNGGLAYDYYETSDGRYLAVGSLEPKFWAGFCAAIGRDDLAAQDMTGIWVGGAAAKEAIRETIAAPAAGRMAGHLQRTGCLRRTGADAAGGARPTRRLSPGRWLSAVPRADGAAQPQIASPFRFSATAAAYRHTGGAAGAQTAAVLEGSGLHSRRDCRAGRERAFSAARARRRAK